MSPDYTSMKYLLLGGDLKESVSKQKSQDLDSVSLVQEPCLLTSALLPVVQLLSRAWHFANPWTIALQASLSFTISLSLSLTLLKLMSIESVRSSNHLILCCPLLLLLSIFSSFRGFSSESSSSHQVVKVLELQLQHQSFQWIFRVDFLVMLQQPFPEVIPRNILSWALW